MTAILGLMAGKPCAASEFKTLLLKHFIDVLPKFKNKFTYRIDHGAPVPAQSLELWCKRGYEPSATGAAIVVFEQTPDREFIFPAYFWSE